jgi:hypothetical protein
VTVAIAADDYNRTTEPDAHYYQCSKCPLGHIPCPGTKTLQGPQGSSTTITEAAYPFDYDGKPYVEGGFGTFGYSTGYNYVEDTSRNCKFILDVCTCGAACEIVPGGKMGIQMYIKTPGVYWADPDYISAAETDTYGVDPDIDTRAGNPTVFFDMHARWQDVCQAGSDGVPTVMTQETAPYYFNADTGARKSGEEGETAYVPLPWTVRNFGPLEYYTKFSEGDNSKGMFVSTLENQYSNEEPLIGEHKGAIPARNRVIALQSSISTDYVFTEFDTADAEGNCKIWVDIPSMRIDPTVAQDGDIVKVQIRLLFNRRPAGICPECDPPDVCDVTLDVAVVCPVEDAGEVGDEYCMFFPYVLQGLNESSGWSTGIAISARDEMPADAWVELKLKDRAGNIATYKRESMGQGLVWAFVLDDVMDNFAGTLVSGATSLTVTSNYSMDGYQFLNVAGQFGAGSNARGCKAGQCCPTVK